MDMSLSLLAAQYPAKPVAPTPEDGARWEHTGLRLRMLFGRWHEDLEQAIAMHVDPTRQAAWGVPDMSSNVFRSVTKQLSCLYDRPPVLDHPGGAELAAPLVKATSEAGLWPLMSRVGTWVIGCREYGVRVHATEAGELQYRPVSPDRLVLGASPDRPDVPVYVKELRLRQRPTTGAYEWTWAILDISDPQNPYERVLLCDGRGHEGQDLSEVYLGGRLEGAAYPYRDAEGRPILPFVLYHAERHGGLWDAFEGSEVVYGSLTAAVLFSFYVHAIRDASWPQRYAVGVTVAGLGVDGSGRERRRGIATDPASILMFQPDGDLQPQLGQFTAGADAAALLDSISSFEQRVAEYAGVSPADLQRLGGTARSGYAIAITNAGKREAQRKFEPQFRASDIDLLRVSAILLNRATGSMLPESGYTIRYQSIPMSDGERDSARKDLLEKIEAGLMSKVDAYLELHPGITRQRAIEELQRIQLEESATIPVSAQIDAAASGGGAVLDSSQVTAAQGIVTAVAMGDLPRDSGLAMLVEFFGISYDAANRIMGTVGLGFVSASVRATMSTGE